MCREACSARNGGGSCAEAPLFDPSIIMTHKAAGAQPCMDEPNTKRTLLGRIIKPLLNQSRSGEKSGRGAAAMLSADCRVTSGYSVRFGQKQKHSPFLRAFIAPAPEECLFDQWLVRPSPHNAPHTHSGFATSDRPCTSAADRPGGRSSTA